MKTLRVGIQGFFIHVPNEVQLHMLHVPIFLAGVMANDGGAQKKDRVQPRNVRGAKPEKRSEGV